MVVPTEQDGKTVIEIERPEDSMSQSGRKQGGRITQKGKKVIVDSREFRSALPSLLFKKGMEVRKTLFPPLLSILSCLCPLGLSRITYLLRCFL